MTRVIIVSVQTQFIGKIMCGMDDQLGQIVKILSTACVDADPPRVLTDPDREVNPHSTKHTLVRSLRTMYPTNEMQTSIPK